MSKKRVLSLLARFLYPQYLCAIFDYFGAVRHENECLSNLAFREPAQHLLFRGFVEC
jgi:hypothetical protein